MRYPETSLKTLIVAATGLLLGAPVALAGYDGPSNIVMRQCTVLTEQFDKAKATHKTDKNYKEALSLSARGKALCSNSGTMQSAGVEDLQSAVKLLGITPSM